MFRVLTPLKRLDGTKLIGDLVDLTAGEALELLAIGAVEEITEPRELAAPELDPEIEGAFPSVDDFKVMDRDALLAYGKEHVNGTEFKGNEAQVRNQVVKAVDALKAQLYQDKAAQEGGK
jgi:hypothetical protein